MSDFPGLPVTVQSSHVDMFGHLGHTWYLQFMEWARFAWSEHIGLSIPTMMEEERIGPALIKAEVRYRKECRLGDELLVTVEPLQARRRLGRVRQTVVRDGEVACEAELWFAMIHLDERTARPLPAAWMAAAPERR